MAVPSSASADRIGISHLVAAVPTLHALGHPEDAAALDAAARAFCDALLALRRVHPGPLHDTTGLPLDALVRALLRAADALRLDGDPEGLGSWCAALAARLGALLDLLDPAVTGVLVFAEEHAGTGRLALVALQAGDLDLPLDGEADR
ncbi:hypothetical protein L6R53_03615 [Myxococcota bacterium]|nr:hypothetical protein [Myxococcota bacterium]